MHGLPNLHQSRTISWHDVHYKLHCYIAGFLEDARWNESYVAAFFLVLLLATLVGNVSLSFLFANTHFVQQKRFFLPIYSRSSPCDYSCKRPALVTTSFSYCERFEPRSHFKGRMSLNVRVLVSLLPPVFRISEVDAYELLRCCFDCTRIARRGVRERI